MIGLKLSIMAGGNQYKCPSCNFVGRLGQLTRHLRENPEHWMVHCQECGVSIVTKKDIARHEEDTGHATGLTPADIINVQKATKISVDSLPSTKNVVKSATKKRLMGLGISEEFAHKLARGRNMSDIRGMSDDAYEETLGLPITEDAVQEIMNLIALQSTRMKKSDMEHKESTNKIFTAKKNKVKSATKRKLMTMGISEENATLLATGRNFTEIKNMKVPDFVKILPDESWNEVLSIAKEIIPDLIARIPHNKRTLEKLMETHDISDGDIVLETALRFSMSRGGKIRKKQLSEAIEFLNKGVAGRSSDSGFDAMKRSKVFTQFRGKSQDQYQLLRGAAQVSKIVGFSVSNFKGFKEARESPCFVPIRPLTLVYGPNNGGKSSILKGFSSLGQTLAKVRLLQGNFDWSPNGMWYKLGASPHVLNNPSNTDFVLGFVLQNDELQELSGRKFHEIRFTFSLETNEGVLTSLEFRGGNFEDYLDPIFTIAHDDSKPTQMTLFGNVWHRFKLEEYSPDLMEKNVQMLDKQTKITTSIVEYTSMLAHLEEKDELQGLRYECIHCGHISNKQKRMKQHLKSKHKLANHSGNYNTLGFNADVLSKLVRFKVLADDYFAQNKSDDMIDFAKNDFLLEMFRSCLQIKKKPGQHPKNFLDFEINLDEDTKKELLDVDSNFNLATNMLHHVRWPGRPVSFHGSSVIEPDVNLLNSLLVYLHNNLDEMDYLGATRLLPQRSYSSQTGGQTSQGVAGERTLAHLANDKNTQRWVNDNLADIVRLNIKVKKRTTQITHHDGTKKTYPLDELDVRISRVDSSEDRLQLPDVGFGVSQLLPILAAIATPGRLVIEEPESNLHPGAQQKLMKKIIEQIVNNKNAEVMMETHSEHFLLEVLRAISDPECPLQDDDVSILYTYNTLEHGTVVKRHTTTNGTLDERFPRDFTGDYGLSLI